MVGSTPVLPTAGGPGSAARQAFRRRAARRTLTVRDHLRLPHAPHRLRARRRVRRRLSRSRGPDRARSADHRHHPPGAPGRRAPRRCRARADHALPADLRCMWRWSTPAWAPRAAASRWRRAMRSWSARTTACCRGRSRRWAAHAARSSSPTASCGCTRCPRRSTAVTSSSPWRRIWPRARTSLSVGTELDTGDLVTLPAPTSRVHDREAEGEVMSVDRFGNVQLSIAASDADRIGIGFRLAACGALRPPPAHRALPGDFRRRRAG